MADEKKTTIVLDAVPEHPMAPAIHTDELWDGPRWVRNAEEKPVWCETKQQYWDLLKKNGFQMLDQAESTVKSGVRREEAAVPIEFTPPPPVAPFTQGEAHLIGAADAVFKGRDCHVVVFHCNHCYARKKFHWCQVVMTPAELSITCECGSRRYVPPKGTTDLFFSKLSSLALHSEAPTLGTIITPNGSINMPGLTLTDMEATILRAFAKMLHRLDLEMHVFHRECFLGDPCRVENEVGMKIAHQEVVLICPCRQLFWRGERVAEVIPSVIH